MKSKKGINRMALTALMFFILALSCDEPDEEIVDPKKPTPDPQNGSYLVFRSRTVMNGTPPAPLDGQLKINVADDLFVVKGEPFMARVSVMHDTLSDITGMYVSQDGNTNEYYDVPEELGEETDSTSTIYIGLQPPDNAVTFPYTVDIHIMPHGEDGTPLDLFTRKITVEDPDDPNACNDLTGEDRIWEWLYTEMYTYQGDGLQQLNAPWFRAFFSDSTLAGGYYMGGCCIDDPDFGLIHAYPGDPVRDGICNEASQYYHKIWINTSIYLLAYEYLFLFSNGTFIDYTGSFTSNYDPRETNFCRSRVAYTRDYQDWTDTGTHDYAPGDDDITLTTEVSDPPFGPIPPSGKIKFTCNTLIISVGIEQKIVRYFRRFGTPGEADPMERLHKWFDF